MKMKKKQFKATKASPKLEDWANRLNPDDIELIESKQIDWEQKWKQKKKK